MKKSTAHLNKNDPVFWIKNKSMILLLSIIMLSVGLLGIITMKSPENLASFSTLSSSIIIYIEYHLLIIAGALGITHTIVHSFKYD